MDPTAYNFPWGWNSAQRTACISSKVVTGTNLGLPPLLLPLLVSSSGLGSCCKTKQPRSKLVRRFGINAQLLSSWTCACMRCAHLLIINIWLAVTRPNDSDYVQVHVLHRIAVIRYAGIIVIWTLDRGKRYPSWRDTVLTRYNERPTGTRAIIFILWKGPSVEFRIYIHTLRTVTTVNMMEV